MSEIPKAKQGRGWVGVWSDGEIGWFLPDHLTGFGSGQPTDRAKEIMRGREPVYLCRITIEPIIDKKGRPIVRYPGKPKSGESR